MASGPMSIGSPSENLVPPPPPADGVEPKHGGFTRFEIELEFVQALANPQYLNHLASRKFLSEPAFVNYLAYLQYWTRPPYLKYLTYPGPTIRHLELLQEERFRQDIINPELVNRLIEEGMRAGVEHHQARNLQSKSDETGENMGGQVHDTEDKTTDTEDSAISTITAGDNELSLDNGDDGSVCPEYLTNEFNSLGRQVCPRCLERKLGSLVAEELDDSEEEILDHPGLKHDDESTATRSETLEVKEEPIMAGQDHTVPCSLDQITLPVDIEQAKSIVE